MWGTRRSDDAEANRRRLRVSAVAVTVTAVALLALSVAAAAQAQTAAPSLVLEQSSNGEVTCVSPSATCSAVNLYGRDGSTNTPPVFPGDQLTTTVQLRNAGNLAASGLHLAAGACENEPVDGGGAVLADLCATVTVAVECGTDGTTVSLEPQTLVGFGQAGSRTVAAPLAAGAVATCRFTVTYPADAPASPQALQAVQPVTWTLMAPDAPTPGPSPAPPDAGGTSPGPATPPGGALAFTGGNALALALAGMVLLFLGGVLHR
ncbi:MAG: hypothetical protein PV358_15770, partial [Acidimicrobiales bacterium]|nr:hypothetical protein [Acidimicrobiales bacterium]